MISVNAVNKSIIHIKYYPKQRIMLFVVLIIEL